MSKILCRKDTQGNPIVFLHDSVHNGKITAWRPGEEPEETTIEFYHSTDFIPNQDEIDTLTKKFTRATGQRNLILQQRLPRKYLSRTEPTMDLAPLQEGEVAPVKRKPGRPRKMSTAPAAKKRGRKSKNEQGQLTKAQMAQFAKLLPLLLKQSQ